MTPDLEHRLRDLSAVIDFPPTPDLAGAVERRLAHRAAAPRLRWGWRTVLIAAALVLVVAAGAGAAVRIWLDVPSVVIRRVAALPDVPAGSGLGLGERTTAQDAAAQAGFALSGPDDSRLGPAEAVYVADVPWQPRISLVWRPRAGFEPLPPAELGVVLTAFPGGTPDEMMIEKMISGQTSVEAVEVGDGAAWWIEGAAHMVVFRTAQGDFNAEELRLAGNVLLWQQDGLVLRLEAQVDRDTAVALARTVRVTR